MTRIMTGNRTTLYVTDLDGTLLGSDSRISQRSSRVLNDLVARGVMITAATARTPATVDGLLRGSGLILPVVVMTGAALWDPVGRRYLSQQFIQPDTTPCVREAMSKFGLHPFVYVIDDEGMLHTYFNGIMSRRERSFAEERSNLPLKRLHIDHPDGLIDHERTILFFAMGECDQVFACAEYIRRETGCNVSAYNDIVSKGKALIEVMAHGVTKASAIARLADSLGAGSVTVFGDNLNDIPMMQAADHSVAVANAMPQVRDMADEVIGPNTEDAVPEYILYKEFAEHIK